ncbi:MAG: hypothetical protein PHW13_10145 [Methylococcales bacterium]|nr:hypothetical protein [Methylococcales bacterium]
MRHGSSLRFWISIVKGHKAVFCFSHSDKINRRVIFLPAQSPMDFINLIAVFNLMLDISSFNGFNTSLEVFAAGTPVVTLPGELQCTRHGPSLYLKMGITDCIAKNTAEYIEIALKLANDPAFRGEVSSKILVANHLLFEDRNTISAFADFFEECVKRHDLAKTC